jgi:toxin FitB
VSFLLDTNVWSELRKRRADGRVAAWFAGVADEDIFLSVLVIGEIRRGIESIRSRDPAQAATLERWLLGVLRDCAERILPVTREVAEEWGRLSSRKAIPSIDGLLAATARVHGLTLVTRNVRQLAAVGVPLLDPFGAAPG